MFGRKKKEKIPKVREKKAKRAGRGLDVILVPHGNEKTRYFNVHVLVVGALLLAAVGVVAGSVYIVYGYSKNIIDISQLAFYEAKHKEQSEKVEAMEEGVTTLEDELEDIDEMRERIVAIHRLNEVRPENGLLETEYDAISPDVTFDELKTLSKRLASIEKNLKVVDGKFGDDPEALNYIPSIPPARGWIERDYGSTVSPFTGRVEMHQGIDITNKRGTNVVATADGVVVFAGLEEHYGLVVEIDHGNGYATRYTHNMRNLVQAGTPVRRGDVIAKMGSTGHSATTHVHYEVVYEGKPINPRFFILHEPEPPVELEKGS
ncbi:MAG: peptidoglycan DD-metalloendopeptidase family protein [Candidatus Coatesbacteria bacterium]|nr:MAG: peptidoglycan DD-metalloendopeptidase family protein [Candidatus Coatesbacteria bacterium]